MADELWKWCRAQRFSEPMTCRFVAAYGEMSSLLACARHSLFFPQRSSFQSINMSVNLNSTPEVTALEQELDAARPPFRLRRALCGDLLERVLRWRSGVHRQSVNTGSDSTAEEQRHYSPALRFRRRRQSRLSEAADVHDKQCVPAWRHLSRVQRGIRRLLWVWRGISWLHLRQVRAAHPNPLRRLQRRVPCVPFSDEDVRGREWSVIQAAGREERERCV